MCFLSRQLPLARALAQACPDTHFVLDHCGVPDIAGGGLDPWRNEIRALAGLPNVTCKLSGLLAYCAPGDASYEAIEPYVAHTIDCFGAQRMLWGSDWPVVDLANGLPDWIAVTRRILDSLGADEAAAIASGTAARVYGV
jgi:predicted TIM-barrel fold metal-dependent hydrolase